MSFPPLIHPPAQPLELPDDEVFVLPRTVGAMVGEGRARSAVREGFLRPADIDTAEIGPVERIWVPLWRVEGSADSLSIDLMETVERVRGPDAVILGGPGKRPPDSRRTRRTRRRVRPAGGFRHHDAAFAVPARRGFPIDPSPKVKIPRADLVPLSEHPIDAAERVLPDVPREQAEEDAKHRLRRRGEPRSALIAKVHVDVRDARLVHYPLYVVRYRYGGEAVEGGPSIFFVAVSGTSGKVVDSRHPSGWRSMGGRLRRFFGG